MCVPKSRKDIICLKFVLHFLILNRIGSRYPSPVHNAAHKPSFISLLHSFYYFLLWAIFKYLDQENLFLLFCTYLGRSPLHPDHLSVCANSFGERLPHHILEGFLKYNWNTIKSTRYIKRPGELSFQLFSLIRGEPTCVWTIAVCCWPSRSPSWAPSSCPCPGTGQRPGWCCSCSHSWGLATDERNPEFLKQTLLFYFCVCFGGVYLLIHDQN